MDKKFTNDIIMLNERLTLLYHHRMKQGKSSLKKQMLHENSASHHIMDTAIPLFATRGYAGVSVRELAQAAGVNIALISYYFGGKNELYTYILATQFEVLGSIVNEVMQEKLSPAKAINRFVQRTVAVHKKYPYLIRLSMNEIINPTPCYDSIVKTEIEKIHHFFKACLQRGIDCGDFKADIDPAVAAQNLVGMINFHFLTQPLSQEMLPGKDNPVEYYVKQSLHHYLQGILSTK